MRLRQGDRLGPYEVVSGLGAGGMGEVYRARDTKLGREVAIKILPRLFTSDPERLARFEREARMLAALNHPHIGAIYGLEDADGVRALVLELVEGDTLADRIRGGPSPMPEALTIARQIADALETAHEKGIIHRDLKPANIKITPDGVVKVLDFGLAKATGGDGSSPDLSQSPTATSGDTREGIVLGTAAYMSPDQARGKLVDKRSDIWAFGCVLYEMLTGRVPFPGETIPDTVAAILGREPDWHALPAATPEAIRRLLRRSLQKDVKLRLRDIADARLEIDEARGESLSPGPAAKPLRRTERLAWLAAVGVLSLIAVATAAWPRRPTPPPPEVQFEIDTPSVSDPDDLASMALSPDAQKLAFVAPVDGQPHLWVRQLDSVVSRPIPGTADASTPFWSPDSRSVAFYAEGVLKRIDLAGGLVRTLTEASAGVGGTWNREGTILLVQTPASPVVRISADGGMPADVTRLGEGHAGHSVPNFLPDGRHFLYYVTGSPEARGVYLGQLDGTATGKLFDAESAAVYASGHLLFVRGGTLFAQGFDLSRLEVTGSPFPVAEGVLGSVLAEVRTGLSAAAGGAIAFRVGSRKVERQFVWADRSGREKGTVGAPDSALVLSPSISPDGSSLAFLRRVNGNSDVWLLDTRRGVLSRFTDHAAEDVFPVWSRDGTRIVFASNRNGTLALYQKRTTGVGVEERLPGTEEAVACDWSPDGRFLLYQRRSAKTGFDLWALPLVGGGEPFPVGQTQFHERDGQFSPDGKQIAFDSTRSGRVEVYVQSFPGPGAALQVSVSGGAQARWRPDGRELFYIALDGRLMAAPIQVRADGQLVVGIPLPLFTTHMARGNWMAQYVVSADGQRFLMNTFVQEAGSTPIRVVLNWQPRS